MAIIKLGNSKSASRAINYAEKRARFKRGVACSSDYAKTSFKAVRMAHGKDDKIQAHTIIQSFKPGEVSPRLANKIGFDLVKSVAKGHQAVVYTHTDTEHIHNHIIINAVNTDTGKKYRSTKNQLKRVLEKSNELCAERGLSTFDREKDKKISGDRHTQAELEIKKTGRESWKDNIRNAVADVKNSYLISSLEEYQEILKKEHDIDLIKRGKTLTYAYNEVAADDNSPLKTRKVRANKLGADYELEQLNQYFEQQKEIKHNNDLLEQQKLLDEQQNQVSVRSNIEIREEIERTVELAADKQRVDQEAIVQEKSVTIVDNTRFDVDYAKKIDKKPTPAPSKEEFEEFDFSTKEKRNKFRREFTARTGIPYKEEGEETAPRKQKTKQKDDGLEF